MNKNKLIEVLIICILSLGLISCGKEEKTYMDYTVGDNIDDTTELLYRNITVFVDAETITETEGMVADVEVIYPDFSAIIEAYPQNWMDVGKLKEILGSDQYKKNSMIRAEVVQIEGEWKLKDKAVLDPLIGNLVDEMLKGAMAGVEKETISIELEGIEG